jgi:YD repeat-containing protein
MKACCSAVILFLSLSASAQYYYKDIVGLKESTSLIEGYRQNKVQSVTLKTYTVNNTPIDNLQVQQIFSPATKTLLTVTKTDYQPASYLTTVFDEAGKVIRITDSTAEHVNTVTYRYNGQGQISNITTQVGDQLAALQTDEHIWQYNSQNQISKMLRIKNGRDTSVVMFKLDEKGNVIEEQETRRFIKEEPFQYYYDAKDRLTDIVRYNKKASRLMPQQMFEYSIRNHVIQRTTIPENSSDYLVWRYRFDSNGLKTREEIYNKQKELTGKVEYLYTFNNQ